MIAESLKKKSCPNCNTKRYYDGRTKSCDYCGYEGYSQNPHKEKE